MPEHDDFVDLSHHNQTVDWSLVDVPGAIIRVADGRVGKDRQFDANWAGSVGKVRSVYYFWYDDIGSATQEATLRSALGDARPPMVFVDVEGVSYKALNITAEERSNRLQDFLTRIDDLNPGIYTAQHTWESNIVRRATWKRYPLWVANWAAYSPALPDDWDDYVLWQHTSQGRVPGITGNVDRNAGRHPIDWYRDNWKEEVPTVTGKLLWPIAGYSRITGLFGSNPNNKTLGYGPLGHMGLDISSGAIGTPVQAMADGVVAYVALDKGYGNYIRIWHSQFKIHTVYAHLQGADVKPGQTVKAGQQIGRVGSTGNSTAAHLHLEIRLATGLHSDLDVPNGHGRGRIDPLGTFHYINNLSSGGN